MNKMTKFVSNTDLKVDAKNACFPSFAVGRVISMKGIIYQYFYIRVIGSDFRV